MIQNGDSVMSVTATSYQVEQQSLHQALASADHRAAAQPLLLSVEEAAKTLGVSFVTIYALANRGALPLVKFGARCTRVRYSDLERLAQEGYSGPIQGTQTAGTFYNPKGKSVKKAQQVVA
jgi:excisionase family DNA binding protein